MKYTVKKLAKIAKITTRTLHYYDEIDLLKPALKMKNGYRIYGEKELFLLQQIMFFRELDFPLEKIKEIIHQSNFNLVEALKNHKKIINKESKRLQALLNTINKTINALEGTTTMTDEELYENFPEEDRETLITYQKEAEKKWGNTEAWKQSQKRVRSLTKEDFKNLKQNGEIFCKKFALLLEQGKSIDSKEVQDMVQQHRDGINFFYDCSLEMYRGLSDLYSQDNRYADYYRKFHPKLPEFLVQAMRYYCDNHTK